MDTGPARGSVLKEHRQIGGNSGEQKPAEPGFVGGVLPIHFLFDCLKNEACFKRQPANRAGQSRQPDAARAIADDLRRQADGRWVLARDANLMSAADQAH